MAAARARLVRVVWASSETTLGLPFDLPSGLTHREVAQRLHISPHAASGHLRHAFEKLGINSRVALTRIAAEHAR